MPTGRRPVPTIAVLRRCRRYRFARDGPASCRGWRRHPSNIGSALAIL